MGRREDSIAARRAALESQGKWRAQRKAKDDRCSDLGVAVVLALRERDSWVAECERRAGEALVRLVEEECLSVRDVVGWCVGAVTASEVARLRRLATNAPATVEQTPGSEAQ
jgi:hypothetical protein